MAISSQSMTSKATTTTTMPKNNHIDIDIDDDDDVDDEEDEEFRRAQEMALAVAALGSGGGGSSSSLSPSMTALDIRMAVADVICAGDNTPTRQPSPPPRQSQSQSQSQQQQYTSSLSSSPDDDIMKLKKQLYAASKEKHVQQAKNEKLKRQIHLQKQKEAAALQQQTTKSKTKGAQQQQQQNNNNFVVYLLSSVWNDTVGPYCNPLLAKVNDVIVLGGDDNSSSKLSLEGINLLLSLFVMNGCLMYLATSEQTWMTLCNAIFIVNATIYLCLTKKTTTTVKEQQDGEQSNTLLNAAATTTTTEAKNKENEISKTQKRQERKLLLLSSGAMTQQQQQKQNNNKKLTPKIRLEWLADISFQDRDLVELESLQPESTLAERRRFLKARKHVVKAASAQLGTYLQWRQDNRLDEFFPSTFTTDPDDWAAAARGALEIANTSGTHVQQVKLPRLVSIFEEKEDDLIVCKNGARIVHVLPCQLDTTLATPSTYALAVAMYLDRKLHREYTEKVTVVIDIRHGVGWTNPSSVSIVPFIKLVVGLLNTYFPERLSRCILFPLPRTATMLFNTAKTYLDPDTAAKIQVCSGAGSVKAVVPDKVYEFMTKSAIQSMEQRRLSFFIKK